jgi:import inner membrane translocase subunit TIM50
LFAFAKESCPNSLLAIGIYKPPDVRPILKAYEGQDIPIEYAKKEAEAKARHVEEWKAKHKGVAPSAVSSWFGLSAGVSAILLRCIMLLVLTIYQPAVPRGQPPPTYLEQKRREAQLQYQEEQKYIRENRTLLEEALEKEQQALAAQVPSNLWEAIDQISGKPKDPSEPEASTSTPTSTPTP